MLPRVWLAPPLDEVDRAAKQPLLGVGAQTLAGTWPPIQRRRERQMTQASQLAMLPAAAVARSSAGTKQAVSPSTVPKRQARQQIIEQSHETHGVRIRQGQVKPGIGQLANPAWLIHWTRECVGPWPEQTELDYQCDSLWNTPRSVHSRLAALRRILRMKWLLGNDRLTRGLERVVCFSEQPLETYVQKRVYRRHLMRWDFEHVGLVFSWTALNQRGVEPVIYGTTDAYHQLDKSQRWRFQTESSGRSVAGRTSWRLEREWRVRGDLDLEPFGVDELVVFVSSEVEASQIAPYSPWPVVYCRSAQRDPTLKFEHQFRRRRFHLSTRSIRQPRLERVSDLSFQLSACVPRTRWVKMVGCKI